MKKLYKNISEMPVLRQLLAPLWGKMPVGQKGVFVVLALLAFLSSCSDWDNHYENETANSADITLWDAIEQRSELSDFAQVLEKTMVFRQHKKTAVSYADILKGGRSLTLFAPVNGTFNKDSIISLLTTAKGDSAVERFFVMNHLSQALVSTDGSDKRFRMLNSKNATISGDRINNVTVRATNIHSKNGIMHVMDAQMPYMKTIYETLVDDERFKSNGAFLASYNEDVFDEDASVSSGLVDGKKVYVDSVVYERNILLNSIGQLEEEDSAYHVVVPTEAGWNKAWKEALDCFVFPKNNPKADSLQQLYAYYSLMKSSVFSETIQPSMNDSVVTYHYSKSDPEYDVFYKPFEANGIFGKAKDRIACSNGVIYATDEWVFDPKMVYQKKIEVEGEYVTYVTDYTACSMIPMEVLADSVSEGRFTHVKPSGGNSNWSVTYKLPNVVSGKYDVNVIVLPKSVLGTESVRPCRFTATINYIDVDGKEQKFVCNDGSPINTNPYEVDTIKVASFKFPACNYGQATGQASITLTCNIRPNENARYDRNFYLDAIVLERAKE